MRQNEIGKSSEKDIEKWFKERKYWCFLIPRTVNGQPFDLIARRKNDVWFVDVKHISKNKKSFTFERIEPNQEMSMKYSFYCCEITKQIGFIIDWEFDNTYYFIEFEEVEKLLKEGKKSVKIESLPKLEELLQCK